MERAIVRRLSRLVMSQQSSVGSAVAKSALCLRFHDNDAKRAKVTQCTREALRSFHVPKKQAAVRDGRPLTNSEVHKKLSNEKSECDA